MLTYLNSLSSDDLLIDILIETILTDGVLLKDSLKEAVENGLKFMEEQDKASKEAINAIVIISKIVIFDSKSLDEDLTNRVLDKLVEILDSSDESIVKQQKLASDYLGSIIVSSEYIL